jgi:hypothetical protein
VFVKQANGFRFDTPQTLEVASALVSVHPINNKKTSSGSMPQKSTEEGFGPVEAWMETDFIASVWDDSLVSQILPLIGSTKNRKRHVRTQIVSNLDVCSVVVVIDGGGVACCCHQQHKHHQHLQYYVFKTEWIHHLIV